MYTEPQTSVFDAVKSLPICWTSDQTGSPLLRMRDTSQSPQCGQSSQREMQSSRSHASLLLGPAQRKLASHQRPLLRVNVRTTYICFTSPSVASRQEPHNIPFLRVISVRLFAARQRLLLCIDSRTTSIFSVHVIAQRLFASRQRPSLFVNVRTT